MRRPAMAAALAAVALAGCAARRVEAPAAAPAIALPDARRLLDVLEARRAAARGLRALARMSYASGGESRRARQIIVAARPDRLRLEVLSPFGTIFVLAADQGRLAAYVPEEGAVYRGAASAENVARYLQIDLPVSTAVDLLLGTPPMEADRDAVVSEEDGAVKLWQDTGRRVYVTWFDPELEPIRYEQRDEDGRVLLRARFSAFADVASVRLPTTLAVELPLSEQRIEIALREPEVNPSFPDATFTLETPAGIREVALDEGAR